MSRLSTMFTGMFNAIVATSMSLLDQPSERRATKLRGVEPDWQQRYDIDRWNRNVTTRQVLRRKAAKA